MNQYPRHREHVAMPMPLLANHSSSSSAGNGSAESDVTGHCSTNRCGCSGTISQQMDPCFGGNYPVTKDNVVTIRVQNGRYLIRAMKLCTDAVRCRRATVAHHSSHSATCEPSNVWRMQCVLYRSRSGQSKSADVISHHMYVAGKFVKFVTI